MTMIGVPKILTITAAGSAMLAGPLWSSSAAACAIPATMSVEMPNATEIVPRQKVQAPRIQQKHRTAANRAAPPPAAGPKLNCAACIGMMPAFESHELMPFMPMAESFTLHVIDAPADPPASTEDSPKGNKR